MVGYRFDEKEVQFHNFEEPIKRELLEKLLYDVMDDLWQKTLQSYSLTEAQKKYILDQIRMKMAD